MADQSLMSALESLGFDTAAGIAAIGGDQAFYVELLRDFQSDYLDRISTIRDEADTAAQLRFAHDLKAVLRMLGETRVAQMAAQWELALRTGTGDGRQQASVCDALDELSRAFATAMFPSESGPT